MDSLKKINRLADRFERKLSLAQQLPTTREADPKAAITDAVFDPKFADREAAFFQNIMRPDSNFQAAAQNIAGKITIGITVDAPAKMVDFTVTSPGAKPEQLNAVKDALKRDYRNMYRVDVNQQFQDRLAQNLIRPPTIRGSLVLKTV